MKKKIADPVLTQSALDKTLDDKITGLEDRFAVRIEVILDKAKEK